MSKGGDYSCSLSFETTPELDSSGHLLINDISLSRDDSCPTWDFESDHYYPIQESIYGSIELDGKLKKWGDYSSDDMRCYSGEAIIRLDAVTLEGMDGQIQIEPSTLRIKIKEVALGEQASCALPQD